MVKEELQEIKSREDSDITDKIEKIEKEVTEIRKRVNLQDQYIKSILPMDENFEVESLIHKIDEIQSLYSETEKKLLNLNSDIERTGGSLGSFYEGERLFNVKYNEMINKLDEYKKKRFLLPFIGLLIIFQILIILYLFLFL